MFPLSRLIRGVGMGGVLVALAFGVSTASGAPKATANCGAKPDSHAKYEVVFRTEPTLAKARYRQARLKADGFRFKTFIEVDGCRAYEVATNRFPNKAAAQRAADEAKALGFQSATVELS